MTALTEDFQRKSKGTYPGKLVALPVNAGSVIFAGAAVATEGATGVLVPAANTVGLVPAGVATEGLDNTAGADGTVSESGKERAVTVDIGSEYAFVTVGTPVWGDLAYIVDDNTVSVAKTTEGIALGRFTRQAESGVYFVNIFDPVAANDNGKASVIRAAISAGAEASDVIELTVQLEDEDGDSVAEALSFIIEIYENTMIEAVAAAFTLAATSGVEVSATANARAIITTTAAGLAVIDLTDIATGSGKTMHVVVRPLASGVRAGDESRLAVTFD